MKNQFKEQFFYYLHDKYIHSKDVSKSYNLNDVQNFMLL